MPDMQVAPNNIITGPAKAAAFLLLIGPDNAKRLADYFSEDELRTIFEAADRIEALSVRELHTLAAEFRERFVANGLVKSPGIVESLFSGMRPDIKFRDTGADSQPEEPARPVPRATVDWSTVSEVEEDRLVAFVENEHPQAGAFVLSRLSGAVSARILKRLASEIRKEVVVRLAEIVETDNGLSREVAAILHRGLSAKPDTDSGDDGDGLREFAGIVNQLPTEAADEVLNYLAARNERKAELVKKWMFRFEAVETLGRTARAQLFDKFAAEEMAMALVGAGDGMKEAILSVLSQRNRRSVDAELQDANFSEEQIADARMKIVNTALELCHEGVISLEPSDEAEIETPPAEDAKE